MIRATPVAKRIISVRLPVMRLRSPPLPRRATFLDRQTSLRHLSMGMSNDFEAAIEEGATMVRIGTLLFGGKVVDEEMADE